VTRHLLHFISDPHASPQPATPRRGRRAKSRGTQRAYEPLERRVMFDGTVTLTDGTLEVIGTSGDDLVRATLIELPDTGETVYQVFSGGRTTNFNPAAVLRVTVLGLGGDDNIAVRNRPANIDGGPGKDNLGGSDFGDILRGGSGDDVIVAFAGNDVVEGGDGNDTLLGLAGNDTLRGGAGDDLLSDTEGTDTFDGGPGTDTINGVTEGGPAELVLQAEDATLVGARAGAANKGYTGTGYADYAHARGDSVEFTFNAPAAGPRTLSFRYANGGTADRPRAGSERHCPGPPTLVRPDRLVGHMEVDGDGAADARRRHQPREADQHRLQRPKHRRAHFEQRRRPAGAPGLRGRAGHALRRRRLAQPPRLQRHRIRRRHQCLGRLHRMDSAGAGEFRSDDLRPLRQRLDVGPHDAADDQRQ